MGVSQNFWGWSLAKRSVRTQRRLFPEDDKHLEAMREGKRGRQGEMEKGREGGKEGERERERERERESVKNCSRTRPYYIHVV